LNTSSEASICWFSPLDAEATEIARYSAQLLPTLEKYVSVLAVEDAAENNNPAWWKGPPHGLNATPGVDPLPVYHIGNNPVHSPVYEASLRNPGLVVLHDLSLVDLARHISREWHEPDWWKKQMLRQYGEEVSGLVQRSANSLAEYTRMSSEFPLFLPFVEDAIGVVVHSSYARNAILGQLPPGSPVLQLNLPAKQPSLPPAVDYRDRPLDFVFCGHVGPNRRLIEFFEAWGSLDQPESLRLHLFGKIHNSSQLSEYARRYGVSEYLNICGYVTDEELEKALQSAHFAINLRWPTMGEASASQLRYWAAALPTLVTDVGWYAELPDDVVCKISRFTEIEDIVELLRDILASPDKYQQMAHRGWEYLGKQHGLDSYTGQFAHFAAEMTQRRLAHSSIERELVSIIGDMCENEDDSELFAGAVQIAVATIGLTTSQYREQES
jgi:glycosyltransferase involved in cell wall biosynthesis